MKANAYLGRAAAGTATILETYTTHGASGDVLQLSTPCSAESSACSNVSVMRASTHHSLLSQEVIIIIVIIARCLVGLQGLPEYSWLQTYHHHHHFLLFSRAAGPV
jgi:hypothetical protein